jgi:phosphoglycolate phosphatase-like HAD superfamily hydrolase
VNLAVFDLDGTLMNTSQVDGDCFLAALDIEFGLAPADFETDLAAYTHVTDSCILHQVFERARLRPPTAEERQRFIDRFVCLLEQAHRSDPALFREVPGASEVLATLGQDPDWAFGVATGGWRASADFKLSTAGLLLGDAPFASANDALSREEIVMGCIRLARRRCGVRRFAKIVSIGDGAWDVRTARALGLPFIGVGEASRLQAYGAGHVVPDFCDPDVFLGLLVKIEAAGGDGGEGGVRGRPK